ncbi:uncharacterized protein LOC134244078 [Saccostrea cucullata]|uniref:uncharacterized protein LOC134244078 n=1 Tax=Saccostrea cuccullata TaxID=36930 RepID=UPI002ED567AE
MATEKVFHNSGVDEKPLACKDAVIFLYQYVVHRKYLIPRYRTESLKERAAVNFVLLRENTVADLGENSAHLSEKTVNFSKESANPSKKSVAAVNSVLLRENTVADLGENSASRSEKSVSFSEESVSPSKKSVPLNKKFVLHHASDSRLVPPRKVRARSHASKESLLMKNAKSDSFRQNFTFNPRSCSGSKATISSNFQTPFKIYIYELPPKFNTDIQTGLTHKHPECYSFEYCGSGDRLFAIEQGVHVHDSHQFSLEVLIHHQLRFSPYRTLDPNQADYFYIPAYISLQCLLASYPRVKTTISLINELFSYLNAMPYFSGGKPHFSTVGKIEKEMSSKGSCPYLSHPQTRNITFLSIERETKYSRVLRKVISVPYPSYIHLTGKSRFPPDFRVIVDLQRNVFILLAAGTRRSTPYRNIILDQFTNKTTLSYQEFMKSRQKNFTLNMVMLKTRECDQRAKYSTIPWMLRSVFCLQPPGDSPTRKSFYDSLLSGCIPVLFPYPDHPSAWAFQNHFNFTEFTITIPYDYMHSQSNSVYDFLSQLSPAYILTLQQQVRRVAQWFQYSIPDGSQTEQQDAMTLIYEDLQDALSTG